MKEENLPLTVENRKSSVFSPITQKDLNLSFEGITQVEKHFLNLVRNYRSQTWLHSQICDLIEVILEEAVSTSVEHLAVQTLMSEAEDKDLPIEDKATLYEDIKTAISTDDETMNEIVSDWGDVIQDRALGELIPLDEDEIKRLDK